MNTTYRNLLILIVSLSPIIGLAQANYDREAIMYSMYQYKGSARSAGVGGAFCSVGPDPGALSINPASVATFRGTEINATFGISNISGNSLFLNQYENRDQKIRFIYDNLSVVFASTLGGKNPIEKISKRSSILKGFGLGITINRVADFNSRSYFEGRNDTNSFIDAYRIYLNQDNIPPSDLNFDNYSLYPELILAYQSNLIRYDAVRGLYTSSLVGFRPKTQSGSIVTRGGITDLSLQSGFNLWDKLYIGASIGMPYLTYTRDYLFMEQDINDTMKGFKEFTYTSRNKTEGIGFNGKFGLIYKPIKYFSIGASISTPTFFNLRDSYAYTLEHITDSVTFNSESPNAAYAYAYRQPFRFNAGATVFFDKYGFFTADYELVDYRRNSFDFGVQNKEFNNYLNDTLIDSKYRVSHNLRTGIELAYKAWRIRGGYAISLSPFQKGVAIENADLSRQSISAGAGYRGKRISVEFAWIRSVQRSYFAPYYSYYSRGEDAVITKNVNNSFIISIGFKLRNAS